ncbi:uncharacterized RING finger protein P4H10.07-like isoform X1 [Chenopodium quinoa]|uniref:uncharacterized RING finger protein P4H10.07-like isoform X1 n=1 Tax=Chenopodium quinoa TaxID=63459 RepID=UPI000B76D0B7|nr:uncharacterized RING finger protein P4H10.07-like isoform X1 [Chenopodium quinoa]
MGSGSSHLGSPPAAATVRRSKVNRTKQRLASLFCGASSTSPQWEDCAAGSVLTSRDYSQQKANKSPIPTDDSIPTSSAGTGFSSNSSPRSGLVASSESSTLGIECTSIHDDSNVESSNKQKCFSEGDEVVPCDVNAESKCHQQRLVDSVKSSSAGHLQHLSVSPNRHATSEIDEFINDTPQTSNEVLSPSLQHVELEPSTIFEDVSEVIGSQSTESGPFPVVSDPGIASHARGDEVIQELIPPGLELFVSDRAEVQPEGNVLHVDVVSISSSNHLPNINNEISTREARRNSRRMFRDAFTSRSSRRNPDFPAILFTTEDSDLAGSHRRWLLDIGDDFFDDGVGAEPWRFGRRSRFTNDRRRNSRSEQFWDRLRGTATESSHRTFCPLDLHSDGSCTCELDEEANALSSISRIILLAEALFEVLDEIHRQPESFSLSMLSVPAPESVVDSLPIKTYEKPITADHGDDVDQCYICLVEYEKGDKIRVLPCHHAYHMSCVDKWLKEIHGVCPLCRGDVRGGATEVAASSSNEDLS